MEYKKRYNTILRLSQPLMEDFGRELKRAECPTKMTKELIKSVTRKAIKQK